ncbi:c-type cytochrome [Flexithrix dorotheae]|uniref:c-type cytochrome n=1 Tax=Flexithrix dorotheae TaxID=70993 RepID=UPI0012FBDE4E|nr:c-type cytochrome [Flexithrix dorotheae]
MKLKLIQLLQGAFICLILMPSCREYPDKKASNPKIDKLKLQAGFQAEHLISPSENEMGSWVSMTFDDKGRLITSDQYGTLYRMEIPEIGAKDLKPTIEKLKIQTETPVADSVIQMGYAQGLLWAFNSLYVMVNHKGDENFEKGSGLYRLEDTDGNDQFDKITLLKAMKGGGEHGPHSVIPGPDGKSLYVIAGNHTDDPEMDIYRNPKIWENDNLFPEYKDPRGHANSRKAPGGWIAKTDPEGKHWELFSSGFRNPFDIAFNEAGDLFTYDSDMEWDLGMPWYRPTRICHVTSGSEFGWRTGNGKWSPSYPDNLPPVLNIGQGSPTGVLYGQNAAFPAKYKSTLFAFDWSFGIIYAIHLKPSGSTYSGEKEEFLSGLPLPLTDGVIGPDGALYFMTGGRRLNSDLYRVYYDNPENAGSSSPVVASPTEENKIRKQLEEFHTQPNSEAIEFAWPYLSHQDRFIQYAARIAVEHQPVDQWKDLVYKETDTDAFTQGVIALARQADKSQRDLMLNKLLEADYGSLSGIQKINLIRAFELTLSRFGLPSSALKNKVIAYLNPGYPAHDHETDRLLSKVLAYLEAPGMIEKTITLLETPVDKEDASTMNNTATDASDLIQRNLQYGLDIAQTLSNIPPQQHTYYALVLSKVESGWTPELRERYFKWFYHAFNFEGGRSYIGFINNARKAALAYLPEDQFEYYNTLSGDTLLSSSGNDLANVAGPKGPGKRYKAEDIKPLLADGLGQRNFVNGKNMFKSSICSSCHMMNGEGGISGPDLTQLGTRFSQEDMLISIIEPNKVVSDQYASSVISLKDGSSIVGKIISEDDQNFKISQNPFAPDMLKEIPKNQVVDHKLSEVSAMPGGLINRLNEEEVKDLLAYLISGGNPDHGIYQAE